MKRIITFLLRILIFLLLILFSYQKITGKQLEGAEFRKTINTLILKVRTNARTIVTISGTEKKPKVLLQGNTSDSLNTGAITNNLNPTLLTIKNDIVRNRNFYLNLQKGVSEYKTSVGKGDVFAVWVSSLDHKHDAVSVTVSGNVLRYPSKYNTDNTFAINNNFSDRIYKNSGLQLLSSNGLHSVFYRAFLQGIGARGIIQNIDKGTSIMMDSLVPLLYYKDRYLFTTQVDGSQKSLFVLNDKHELETLGGRAVDNVAIDNDVVAFQDTEQGMIYFLGLDNLKMIKTIDIGMNGVSFQGFVIYNSDLRISIRDNVNNKMIYQKRRRERK